jgi:hypothetical protein
VRTKSQSQSLKQEQGMNSKAVIPFQGLLHIGSKQLNNFLPFSPHSIAISMVRKTTPSFSTKRLNLKKRNATNTMASRERAYEAKRECLRSILLM